MKAEVTAAKRNVQARVVSKSQAQLLAKRGITSLAQNDLLDLLVFLRAAQRRALRCGICFRFVRR